MAKRLLLIISIIMVSALASRAEMQSSASEKTAADSVATKSRSWSPKPKLGPNGVHFAWGAEFGSTIDMSGHEMSSVDFNVSAGLSYKWLSFAGVGVGANIIVSNSCRTYPVYAHLRTDFSNLVKFLFLDMRGGVAFNNLEDNVNQTGAYISPAIGFNLATGNTFRSYITVGYTYIHRKDVVRNDEVIPYSPLSMATVRLGIAF